MDEFIKIAELSELREGKGIVRRLEDDSVAIVKLNDDISAFVNSCPHQHTPLVDGYGGQIAGEELTCPMHGWTYNLKTGKCVNQSGKLRLLETRVVDSTLYVRKPEPVTKW